MAAIGSRRLYVALAAALRADRAWRTVAPDGRPWHALDNPAGMGAYPGADSAWERGAYDQWHTVTLAIAGVLAADNPRFDPARFLVAAGCGPGTVTAEQYAEYAAEARGLVPDIDAPKATATESADIAARLDYLRGEIRAERMSWSEIAELQSLAAHIAPEDVELLEWAGVPEFGPEREARARSYAANYPNTAAKYAEHSPRDLARIDRENRRD